MADWREGNNGSKGHSNKPSPGDKRQNWIAAENSSVHDEDWRGGKKPTEQVKPTPDSHWTGTPSISNPGSSASKKIAMVSLLGLAMLLAATYYIVFIYQKPIKVPVIYSVATEDREDKLFSSIPHPFGNALNAFFEQQLPKDSIMPMKVEPKQGPQYGGPDKKLRVLFVSCNLKRTEEGTWKLYSDKPIPLVQLDSSDRKLELYPLEFDTFFRDVAKRTDRNRFTWIVLDLQQPAVSTDLEDLYFPVDEIRSAWDRLGSEEQEKLIVTLPCSDASQQNWLSPEYQRSAFANFFLEGISTGFPDNQTKIDAFRGRTIKDFETLLKGRVYGWASERRYARQVPLFLIPASAAKLRVCAISSSNSLFTAHNLPPKLKKRLDELNDLWESGKWVICKEGFHWDPVGFARIEKMLIQLESIAISCGEEDEEAWNGLIKLCKEGIEDFNKNSTFLRRASLVEVREQSLLPRPTCIKRLYQEQKDSDFNEEAKKFVLERIDAVKSPMATEDIEFDKLKTWYGLVTIALGNNDNEKNKALRGDQLGKLLPDVSSSEPKDQPEWVEIQFLSTLQTAIDWDKSKDPANEKMIRNLGNLIVAFHSLQQVSSSAFPEVTNALQNRCAELDVRFLKQVDNFIANEFDDSFGDMEALRILVRDKETLEDFVRQRNKFYHILPHALSAIIQHYRIREFSKSPESKDNNDLEELTRTIVDSFSVLEKNPIPNTDSESSIDFKFERQSKALGDIEKKCISLFNNPTLSNDTGSKDQQGLHLRMLVARWPSYEPRNTAHEGIIENLKVSKNISSVKIPEQEEVQNDPYVKSFSNGEIGKPLVNALNVTPTKDDYIGMLYARALAGTDQAKDLDRLLADYDKAQIRRYAAYNIERLGRSMWGDGARPNNSDQYYFVKLAKLYDGQSTDDDITLSSPKEALKTWDFGSITRTDSGLELRPVGINSLHGTPSLRWDNLAPLKDRFAVALNPNEKLPIRIDDPSIDIEDRKLRMTFRGHFLAGELNDPKSPDSYEIQFERIQQNTSKVLVSAGSDTPASVMVLFDCSHSMHDEDSYSKAHSVLQRLIDKLKGLIEQEERQIDLRVVVFAVDGNSNDFASRGWRQLGEAHNYVGKTSKEDTTPKPYSTTAYITDDKGWTEKPSRKQLLDQITGIEEQIDLLGNKSTFSGRFTPLYQAITASAKAMKPKRDGENIMIVITDGCNFAPPQKGDWEETERDEQATAQRELMQKKAELFAFLYDNKSSRDEVAQVLYRLPDESEDLPDKSDELLKRTEDYLWKLMKSSQRRTVQLQDRRSLGYKNFEDIWTDINKLFPSWEIKLEEVEPKKSLAIVGNPPSIGKPFRVELKGTTNAAAKLVVQRGDERARSESIQFTGGEYFQLIQKGTAIEFCTLDEDLKNRDKRFGAMIKENMKSADSEFTAKAYPFTARDNQIIFRSAVGRKDNERRSFTSRPLFAIAELETPDTLPYRRVLLSEFKFLESHYPLFEFPSIRWSSNSNDSSGWISEKVNTRFWFSQEIPRNIHKEEWSRLHQMERGLIPGVEITCRLLEEDTVAEIELRYAAEDDRVIVFCPTAGKIRRLVSTNKEIVTITRPKPDTPEVSVYFLPRKQLDQLNELRFFEMNDIPIK